MSSSYQPKPPKERKAYTWKPKPKKASLKFELRCNGGVRVYPDGREICQANYEGKQEYHRRLQIMIRRQNYKCCLCGVEMNTYNATFEHRCPRGLAGASRDDRIENEKGEPMNGAAHWACNVAKGSRRI